jgi:hypothetical protein
MNWSKIREHYPNQFVLVEAISAYSKDHKRNIEEMGLVKQYQNAVDAWNGYKKSGENSLRMSYTFSIRVRNISKWKSSIL